MAEKTRQEKLAVVTSVPPVAAGVSSLIVPGLGQIIIGQVYRGLLILASLASALGIFWWRVAEIGRRQVGFFAKVGKALDLEPVFVILTLIFVIVIWLLNAYDAFKMVSRKRRSASGVFLAVLGGFFVLGWQVSEIDIVTMIADAPDAWGPLQRVIWPWQAAFERDTEQNIGTARIRIGEEGDLPAVNTPSADEPYIIVTPTAGELSELDGSTGELIPGTMLDVEGGNFTPDTETQIWWVDPLGNEFQIRQSGEYVSVMTDANGAFALEVLMPYRLTPPSAEGPLYHEIEARQTFSVGPLRAADPLKLTIGRMIETIFMGMMATLFGIVFAIPVSFLAARNIMGGSRITMSIYFLVRMLMNIIRSIEPLIWALIAVVWVGLGPFAGIVALTLHSIAALTKLYSEAIEGIDPGPIEAVRATGANSLQTIMYAVVPQMISPFISFSIYRWDINVRMSTVIGLVGGGGIGFLLVQYIRLLNFRAAGISVWFIAITVAILDYVSADIRERFV